MIAGRRLARAVAAMVTAAIIGFGLKDGLFVAAAADAYGYVSEADLWARGQLVVQQPFAREMTWPNRAASLAPLGYRPRTADPADTDIVPTFSPGVPMVMAVFKLVFGARAVFWVVPLLGGVAVWATYLMGSRLAGDWVGVAAAILLASSPTFLFEVVAPASDVACTAWWALGLALLLFEGSWAALGAGLAIGLAILTRPNLAPLAVVPGALLLWRAVAERFRGGGMAELTRLVLFAAGSIPACIAVGLINRHLYGAPLASGYGSLASLYDWSYLWPNLGRYPRWLVETETVFVLLGLAGPFVLRRSAAGEARTPRLIAALWLVFAAGNVLSYLFYVPAGEEWYDLRYLMPSLPVLLALTCAVLAALAHRLNAFAKGAGVVVPAFAVAVMAWHGLNFSWTRGAHLQWMAEQRYAVAGRYVAATLPERAVLIAMQHSGGARYYSGRITVRYDAIQPSDLDLVVGELRRLGYVPYVLLDDWEEPQFRERFRGQHAVAGLDRLPVASLASDHVKIYGV